MKCTICGITIDLTDGTPNEDWVPYFFEGDEEHGPACSDCSRTLFQKGNDGEMEVQARYRGKIIYQDEPFEDEDPEDYVLMGMILN